MGWRVSIDEFSFRCEDGSRLSIPYIHPARMFEHLLDKYPVLLTGETDSQKVSDALSSFWDCYKGCHPGHEVYKQFNDNDLCRVVPFCIHGDGGRGKKRSNTTVMSWEAVIGWKGCSSSCSTCSPFHLDVSKMKTRCRKLPHSRRLRLNMKGHSYMQRFPLFILPGLLCKEIKQLTAKILEHIADHFYDLFYTGVTSHGQQWYLAAIGCKADLKFVSQICNLVRGYERKGRVRDLECCHLCLAGRAGLPAEDICSSPAWLSTLHSQRPWNDDAPPCLFRVPFDQQIPESFYRHDVFHVLRLGVYRDFTGSAIFWLIRSGFYGGAGTVDVKLERVHGHFKLFLAGRGKGASLRSFTSRLFCYTSKKSYPWINCKGSDCTLILKFLAVATAGFLNECTDQEQRRVLTILLSSSRLAVKFFDLMYAHGIWMDQKCAALLWEVGISFTNGYSLLAHMAMESQQCLFAIKPKIHFQCHVLTDLKSQVDGGTGTCAVLNPAVFDCQQNEDFIGRMCKLSRQVDSRTLMYRTLRFYLIKVSILAKRHLKDH